MVAFELASMLRQLTSGPKDAGHFLVCTQFSNSMISKSPVRPVSSSKVNKHSKGGSLAEDGRSNKAKAAATPMPLSAPSVVPWAYIVT